MRAFGSVFSKAVRHTGVLGHVCHQSPLGTSVFSRFGPAMAIPRSSTVSIRAYSSEKPPSSSTPEEKPRQEEAPKPDNDTFNEKKPPSRDRLLPATGPLSPIGIGLFLATAAGIVYYFTVTKERVAQKRAQEKPQIETYGKAAIGGAYELTDQNGNVVTDTTFRGKFALVYFGFCHCPDICPDEMDKMGDALDALERDNPKLANTVQPIFITCDPQRDSPEAIKEYLKQFHPRFVGLTGSFDQVRKACKAYRVYFSKPPKVAPNQDYLVDHSIFSYLMDPDGEFVDVYGKDKPAGFMATDIERRINQYLDAGRTIEK
ncbi:Cu-binding protein [Coemansia sp. RSA 1200]|nr:Cu-binding protein [Coemansia sp. RSA 1200]